MNFEYTITNVIYVDKEDFQKMKKLIQNGVSYDEAFDRVSNSWDDENYYNRNYVRNAVITELKRRIAQSEEAKKE